VNFNGFPTSASAAGALTSIVLTFVATVLLVCEKAGNAARSKNKETANKFFIKAPIKNATDLVVEGLTDILIRIRIFYQLRAIPTSRSL
jgi:hypothetical protein